jgi:hypothetical protein
MRFGRRPVYVRFGSKADICSALGDVRLVPKRTSRRLFDHLVGTPD